MITARDLDDAFAAFEANDVSLAAVCQAFSPSDAADREALPRLAAAAFASLTPPDATVAGLLALVDRWGSFIARQGLAGTLFVRLGRFEDALAAHAAALRITPRWHATSAYRVLDAIAEDLYRLDRFEESARFAERALRFDPTNPYVLLTLGRAAARLGDSERAAAIHAYLVASGYPMPTWGAALTELVDVASLASPPYAPDLRCVGTLSDESWARFVAVRDLNPFTDLEENHRAHAIACLQRGRYDYAVLSSLIAPNWQADRAPFDPKIIRPWNQARAVAIGALPEAAEQLAAIAGERKEQLGGSAVTRMMVVEVRARAGDREGLAQMLFDPERAVMIAASKALLRLGYHDHVPLLEAMAAAEKLKRKTGSAWGGASAEKTLAIRKKAAGGR